MNRIVFFALLASIFTSGCSTKREVMVGSERYTAVEQWTNKEGLEKAIKLEKRLGAVHYPAIYIAATESAGDPGSNTDANLKKQSDPNLQSAKLMGAALAYNSSVGLPISALDISYFTTSLLLTDLSDAVFKIEMEKSYENTINGSIQLAKIWNDKNVLDSLSQGIQELSYVRDTVCGFRFYPNASNKMHFNGDFGASITGKCANMNGIRTIFATKKMEYIAALKDKNPSGSLFTYLIQDSKKTPAEIAEIQRHLPQGWYMMYADSLRNGHTGELTKMYRIWKDGEERAFPLPDKPVFR